jgi:hypothetical protein
MQPRYRSLPQNQNTCGMRNTESPKPVRWRQKISCPLVVPGGASVKSIAATFLLLLGAATPAFARQELVLIVSAQCKADQLDPPLARRLFLGLTVAQNGVRLRPLLNESDPQFEDLFLQYIVSMSSSTYDRYLLRLALIQGRTKPPVYRKSKELIDAVAADPTVVSYAWIQDAVHDPRIRVLRIVWHD